jgi:DNA-binding CsgD family transcriptional regulator
MSLSTEKITALYVHGRQSCAQIASIDGRSETTIYNLLINNGIEMRNRSEANKVFSDFILIALYNLGLSCSQIGKLLDIHPTTIIKRLELNRFPLRSKKVAAAIRYSNEEFNEFFNDEEFVKQFLLIKLATCNYLGDIIDE